MQDGKQVVTEIMILSCFPFHKYAIFPYDMHRNESRRVPFVTEQKWHTNKVKSTETKYAESTTDRKAFTSISMKPLGLARGPKSETVDDNSLECLETLENERLRLWVIIVFVFLCRCLYKQIQDHQQSICKTNRYPIVPGVFGRVRLGKLLK